MAHGDVNENDDDQNLNFSSYKATWNVKKKR